MADPNDTAAADERARKARADRAAADKAAAATAGTKDVETDEARKTREVREAQEAEAAALTAGEIPPDPSQEVADAIKAGTYEHDITPGVKRDTKADDQRAGYKTR